MLMLLSKIYFPNSDEYNVFTILDLSKLPSVSFDTWGLDKLAILEDKYGMGTIRTLTVAH